MAAPMPTSAKQPTQLELIEEALSRGMQVPPDKLDLYDEAVRRGLVRDVRETVGQRAMADLKSIGEGAKNTTVGLLNMGNDIAHGARNMVGGWMGLDPADLDAMDEAKRGFGIGAPASTDVARKKVESVTGQYEPRNREERYMRSFGDAIPGMLLEPGTLAQRAVAGVGGAIGSEFGGEQFKDTPLEVPARIAGSIIGSSIPDAVRRGFTPMPINQARLDNVRTLRNEGIPTTAGQRTGSRTLRLAEEELGGGATARIADAQDEAFTAATGRRIGIDAPRLGPAEFRRAYQDVDTTFTNLANRTNLPLDTQLQNDLLDAVTRYHNANGQIAQGPELLMNRIAQLAGANNGVLTGPQYRAITTELRELAESNPALNGVVHDMRNALDSNIERNIAPGLRAAWREARTRYGNLMTVQDAMTKAGEKVNEGLVTPQNLRSAVDQGVSDRRILTGNSELGNLARAGSNVMAPLANSNTAARGRIQALGATVLAAIGGAAGGATGDLSNLAMGVGAGSAIGIGGPLVVGRALMSRPVQAYLSNQLFSGRGLDTAQKAIIALMQNNPRIREKIAGILEGNSNGP